jgi:hypothetical protein
MPLLLLGLAVAPAGAATTAPAPVIQPAGLVALEARMEQLPVQSEAYTQRIDTAFTIAVRLNGLSGSMPQTRTTYESQLQEGLASITPLKALVRGVTPKGVASVQIGSDVYLRLPKLAQRDRGRPWVRFTAPESSAFQFFPYHATTGELIHVGSGPWANLINLLATATAPATLGETVVMDGQNASEFTVPVDPEKLYADPLKELATALGAKEPETLQLFIAESGLPLKVVRTSEGRTSQFSQITTETTEITAVNTPFTVTAPPARQTIGERRFQKLLGEFGGLLEVALGKRPRSRTRNNADVIEKAALLSGV